MEDKIKSIVSKISEASYLRGQQGLPPRTLEDNAEYVEELLKLAPK